ncbi:hypothetical protein VKT23_005325 [Stygiomarasmius scandens]|uniref:Proteophosphoglycan ppg4 n=1 Tax=Marasmiellus scandens TaxID=2682957 RepID=A0ABR1JT38_9AGAR
MSWWKFNKPKKQPNLQIQDPPQTPQYTTRPPSKSISSAGDSEPRTPNDSHRRQSLLTLSDPDPFAAPRPSHLDPEYVPKQPPQRISYASASSSSYASDIPSIQERPSKSAQIRDRLSQPEMPTPRPPLRARGMTDAGSAPQPKFFPDSPTSPRVVVRQPSIQRMGMPPSAPPSTKLPPPPPIPSDEDEDFGVNFPTSKRLSYGSTRSARDRDSRIQNQQYVPRPKHSDPPHDSPNTSSRTLKKALSHQSLTQKSSTSSSATPPPLPEDKGPRKQRSFHHPRIPPLPLTLRNNETPSISRRGSSTDPPTPGRKRLFSGSSLRRPSTAQSLKDKDEESDIRSVFSYDGSKPATLTSSFWDEREVERPVDLPSSPKASTIDYTPQQIISPSEMLDIEARVQESKSGGRERGMSIVSASTVASTSESDFGMHSINGLGSIAQSLLGGVKVAETPPASLGRSTSILSNSSSISRAGGGGSIVSPKLPTSPSRLSTGSAVSHPHSRPNTACASTNSSAATSPTTCSPSSTDHQGIVSLSPPPRRRRTTRPGTDNGPASFGSAGTAGTGSSQNSNSISSGVRVSIATGPGTNGHVNANGSDTGRRSRSGSLTMSYVPLNPSPRTRVVPKPDASRRRSLMKKPSFLDIDMDDEADADVDIYAHADGLDHDLEADLAGMGFGPRRSTSNRLDVQVKSRERSNSNSHSKSRESRSRDGSRDRENMEVTVSRVPSSHSHGLVAVKPLNLKRDASVVKVQPRRDLAPAPVRAVGLQRQESFLDLARESFDTARSDSEGESGRI